MRDSESVDTVLEKSQLAGCDRFDIPNEGTWRHQSMKGPDRDHINE